jgi:putative component of membrane protein insertase Oxa1/YidC/SpoIIIJ protein YidD
VLISFHQRVITQIDGPRSHFRPSSSQYTLDAIEKYGLFKGFIRGCDRLLRENEEAWIYPERLNEHGELYKWDPVR